MDPADWSERVELFFGAASESMCRVYARLDTSDTDGAGDAAWKLTGSLTGPTCEYAATLPATCSLVDAGPGPMPLAKGLVPDPCYWTPSMPHLYQATVEIQRSGQTVGVVERTFGMRPLAASGRGLRFGSKSWVVRGARRETLTVDELSEWHAAEVAVLISAPDDALCEAASRQGVLLLAELTAPDRREIRRLVRWPAVGALVLPSETSSVPGGLGHNVILGQRFAFGATVHTAPWADVALCEVDSHAELPPGALDCDRPVLVIRPEEPAPSAAGARSACDRLQRDLAPRGQFAGYIV